MDKNIQVTVYCAAYNHEKYIRQALEGFVMQKTNFDFEVLVHDDASTDGTASIIKEFELAYPDIIKPIYQTENQHSKGVDRIYTWWLPITRGKYIAVCEGDDYWTDPLKLQKQYDYMEANPDCSLVAHTADTLHEDTGMFVPYTTKYEFTTPEKQDVSAQALINDHLIFPTASMFYKTEYYVNNEAFIRSIKSFDYVTKILLASTGRVHVLPDKMSVYRKGADGSWSVRILADPEKFMKHTEVAVNNLEQINKYTSYKYDSEIKEAILKRRFEAYYTLADTKTLKKPPYLELYKKLSFKNKVYMYLTKYAPWAASAGRGIYRKIKHKKIKSS
ncbi:MAG: glycosyltransferase [Ruminococcaceae bacterium]|nr:glycosyltransferase [Oscillospiraceae bacterium]